MKTPLIFLCLILGGGLAYAAQTNTFSPDKPWRLYVVSDTLNYDYYSDFKTVAVQYYNDGAPDFSQEAQDWEHNDHTWTNVSGGTGTSLSKYQIDDLGPGTPTWIGTNTSMTWLTWTTTNSSSVTVVTNMDGSVQTNAPVSPIGSPQTTSEHCVVPDDERNPPAAVYTPEGNPPSGIFGERLAYDTVTQTYHDKYTRTAQTHWRLETGGKHLLGRQSLWQFTCPSVEILNKRAQPVYLTAQERALPLNAPVINGHALCNDGTYWLTLPDGTNFDMTPYVAGKDFYTFWPEAQKYKLTLTATTNNTTVDLSTNTPEFCVGQYVTFAANWDSTPPGIIDVDTISHWTLPAKYVNESWQQTTITFNQPYGSINYRINSALLQNTNQTSCWFVNGQGGTAGINMNLHFSNGQYVSIAAVGDFTIYRPTFSGFQNLQNGFSPFPTYYKYPSDDFGVMVPFFEGNMRWRVTLDSKYDGLFGVTQLLTSDTSPYDTGGVPWLDGDSEIYGTATNGPDGYTADNPSTHDTILEDHPRDSVIVTGCSTMKAGFDDYLRFMPSGNNSIYITIGKSGWYMDGAACRDTGITKSNLPPASRMVGLDDFPVWTGVRPGG